MPNFALLGRAILAIGLASFAASAQAHSTVKGVGDLYAGLLHVLTALEHLLPFIALSLLAGQRGLKSQAEAVLLVFPVALMIGAAAALWAPPMPGLAFFNMVSAILLGGLVASAWPLPGAVFYGLVVVFGLSHGFANGEAIVGKHQGLPLHTGDRPRRIGGTRVRHAHGRLPAQAQDGLDYDRRACGGQLDRGHRRSRSGDCRKINAGIVGSRVRAALIVQCMHRAGHACQRLLQQRSWTRKVQPQETRGAERRAVVQAHTGIVEEFQWVARAQCTRIDP